MSAVGAYIHNEGSLFSQVNAGYVGGVASWDVWDWGTTTSGVGEAKSARAPGAARATKSTTNQARGARSVRRRRDGERSLVVAQAAVASAEENFRLVKKRYEANAATSFDVVDAEGLLTQARGQQQTALYDLLIARASLKRAMGESPSSLSDD